MDISYDHLKNEQNISNRGLSFERVREFEWDSAFIQEDKRREYKEQRFQALGCIGARLFMLIFTPRPPKLHVISLRKANPREVKRYEKETQSHID